MRAPMSINPFDENGDPVALCAKVPPGIDVVKGDSRNTVRAGHIADEFRAENESPMLPPPIRTGMNPLRLPP